MDDVTADELAEDFDETLAARFAVLDEVDVPDVWLDGVTAPAQRTRRARWVAAAASVVVLGVGFAALGGEADDESDDGVAVASPSSGPVLRPIENEVIGWVPNEARVLPSVARPGDEITVVFGSIQPGCVTVRIDDTTGTTLVPPMVGCDDSLSDSSITYVISVDTPTGEYQVCAVDETGVTAGGCGRVTVVDAARPDTTG